MTVADLRTPSHGSTPISAPVPPTPHYPWCAEHGDRFPTVHESEQVVLVMPAGWLDGTVSARIAVDDDFAEAPELVLSVDGSGMSVPAAEAVAFADSLEAFAARVRGLARLAVAQ